MLTAPLRPTPEDRQAATRRGAQAGPTARTGAMRRRRVMFVLLGAFALSVGWAFAGHLAGWLVAVVVAATAAAYCIALSQVRRKAARREWDLPSVGDVAGWEGWRAGLEDRSEVPVVPVAPVDARDASLDAWAMCRFAFGTFAAWVLTPVVAIAEQMAGGARADSRRQLWLAHLQRMQRYGRQQSMTALKVSMVATAGVGSLAAVGLTTAPASAASVATASSSTTHYTVAVGDTLGAIAQRFGTTVSALANANGISDPNLIFVGQELVLSGSASGLGGSDTAATGATGGSTHTAVTAPSTTYTVQAGDTLGAIAAHFGTTVSALASANGIADPNLIVVGQVLHVGGSASQSTTPVAATPTATTVATTPAATTSSTGSHQSYTVQAGDTLGAIAQRFGTTVSALATTNGIANPNLIQVGQVLVIGGSSATLTSAPVLSAPAATTPAASTPVSSTPVAAKPVASAPVATKPVTSTPAAPAPVATTASTQAATAVRVALAQVGKPYVWGGAGPDSFDCSGLVMYAYAAAGISMPHYTVSQFDSTTPITEAQLEPGDLVFYDTGDGAQPGHVTMYIGNGQVVSANSPGSNVQTQSMGYDGTIMGFRRVVS